MSDFGNKVCGLIVGTAKSTYISCRPLNLINIYVIEVAFVNDTDCHFKLQFENHQSLHANLYEVIVQILFLFESSHTPSRLC